MKKKPLWYYYILLISVVVLWSLDPIVYSIFYRHFSATVVCAIGTTASFLFFLILANKNLKNLNVDYLKIAVPLGALNGLAGLLQRIGLQYTTPANYSFLENLACIVVPIAMFAFVRKRPTWVQWLASLLCLTGCFIMSGANNIGLNVGNLLCGLAGILYGINLAAVGVFAKKLNAVLYMVCYMGVYAVMATLSAIVLNAMSIDGVPIEPAKFTLDIGWLAAVMGFGLMSIGITWMMRIEATKHIHPTAVAVISPFTSVLVALFSVLMGMDTLRWQLIASAFLILTASIISGLATREEDA